MILTQRQKIIVGIVIGLGIGLIIYFITKKSCTPNCTGKNCGDDDGCEGKCKDNCPGYRCTYNGCTQGDPCKDKESGCYSDQNCGGNKCSKGIRFRKNIKSDKIYFDVDWSDFDVVKSTTKLQVNVHGNVLVYLNTSSISHFLEISPSRFKFNDGTSITSYPSNIESVEYLGTTGHYLDLLCISVDFVNSTSLNYTNMSDSNTKTQLDHDIPIKFIGIFRPIFLRIYKSAEKEQSTVYYDLDLKNFYPLLPPEHNPYNDGPYYGTLWRDGGFYYGIDICTLQENKVTFNDTSLIITTNVDRFEVISTEENPAPFDMMYANSCLLHDTKGTPTVFENVTITPNSKQMVNMKDKSISFFSF